MQLSLDHPLIAQKTGRGVRVAVLDSGIHASHPHVGGVVSGTSFISHAAEVDDSDYTDRIGHGTAVAAAIREKSPDAELIAVRIFDRQLTSTVDVLCRAIVWSADNGARLINLSLGTANAANADQLAEAVTYARSRGALVIAAAATGETQWFPGSLPHALGVIADTAAARECIKVHESGNELPTIMASPFPRPIPGVPRERNLAGVSFAVANTTGILARLSEDDPRSIEQIIRELTTHPARASLS